PNTYPSDVNVTTLTSTSIYISWQPIPLFERNGIITVYNISYHSLQRNHNGIIQTLLTGRSRNYTAFNLKYFSQYKVSIYAFTVAGMSPGSNELTIRTLQSG
ncbi:uncharacterized protein TRIADDRAFT_7606, partial [Trichoplax adhaerens]